MSTHSNHPYHLVDQSPWPLTEAIGAIIIVTGIVKWFHTFRNDLIIIGLAVLVSTIFQWWQAVTREGTYQGLHTYPVVIGLQWGIILFITSEVLFFVSFFWAYFHRRLSPTVELGRIWPPKGITPFDPISIPMLNPSILLVSGVTVTWAHHSIMEGNQSQGIKGLFFTVLLGIYFTILQDYEYIEAPFTIADSVYGSTFFMATGFHGIHVIIGSLFLSACGLTSDL